MRSNKFFATAVAATKTSPIKLVGAVSVLMFICSVGHASTLLGDTIDARYMQSHDGLNEEIATVTVTNSPLPTLPQLTDPFSNLFTVTISSSQIVVNDPGYPTAYCCGPPGFNGIYFINETVALFPSYVVDPSTSLPGGSPVISIVGNTLEVNWGGEDFTTGQLVLDFQTPLPSTWTMMLIGLAGLGFVAYRRQKQTLVPAV